MTAHITAYTDFRSPYTFVAKAEVYRWQEDFGVSIDWWPFTTPLEDVFGPGEGRNARQLRKIKYMYTNVRRLAAAQGLTIRGTKRIFDPTPAHIGLLQAKDDGIFRAYHDTVFERVFRRELDPDNADHVRATIGELGGDTAAYSARLEGGAAELAAIDRQAEAQGVFGVPSFILDGELFWGTDTLPQIRDRLASAGIGRGSRSL